VRRLLQARDWPAALQDLKGLPPAQALRQLQACLPSSDPRIKWRAVQALGQLAPDLAARDIESLRNFVRRLLWALNEESGAVPWGMAEGLGETLARVPALAQEYACLLVCHVWPEGRLLAFAPLQRGAVWALGRLAQAQPELLRSLGAVGHLLPLLDWLDPGVRGLAVWALGLLGAGEARDRLAALLGDQGQVEMGQDGEPMLTTVADLAARALARL